jgi:hypothetical protein
MRCSPASTRAVSCREERVVQHLRLCGLMACGDDGDDGDDVGVLDEVTCLCSHGLYVSMAI